MFVRGQISIRIAKILPSQLQFPIQSQNSDHRSQNLRYGPITDI